MRPVPSTLLKIKPLDPWLPSLLRRYAKFFKHRYSVEQRQGALFLLDQVSKVDRNLLLKGAWEPDNVALIKALMMRHAGAERRIFLDIGAHGAFYAILCAKELAFDRIVIVEADPANIAKIHANLLLNGLAGKAEVLHAVASGTEGDIDFNIATDSSRSHFGIGAGTPSSVAETMKIPAVVIDQAVQERGVCVIAKLDVEGHELDVLYGMEELLKNNFGVLQIECLGINVEPLHARMAALGYVFDRVVLSDHFFVKEASAT